MAVPLVPDYLIGSVFELTPETLRPLGVRVVLADLDNTLARYREMDPSEAVCQWRAALAAAGIAVFIVSNGRRPGRSRRFAEGLGTEFVHHAGKPRPGAFRRALAQTGCRAEEALMVGDQIFTDIWGAHNAGIRAALVCPVALDSAFRRLRYWVETPFRARCPHPEGLA